MSKNVPINTLLPQFAATLDPIYVEAYNKNVVGHYLEHQVSIEEVRANPGKYRCAFGVPLDSPTDQCLIQDLNVEVEVDISIKVRSYQSKSTASTPAPAYVNFHGGGWTIGDVGSDDRWCRHIAVEANATVFDVGYRLAPEHKFPIAIEDSWKVLQYIVDHASSLSVDTSRIGLGGGSAGANIAAVLTHRCIETDLIKPVFLCLCVPVTDAAAINTDFEVAEDCPYDSWRINHDGPFLSHARMSWFYKQYLGPNPSAELLRSPLLSPLYSVKDQTFRADKHPPTLVCVAEVDVLASEGEAYAKALAERGVEVTFKKFLGVPHNFSKQTVLLQQAREYEALSTEAIAKTLRR